MNRLGHLACRGGMAFCNSNIVSVVCEEIQIMYLFPLQKIIGYGCMGHSYVPSLLFAICINGGCLRVEAVSSRMLMKEALYSSSFSPRLPPTSVLIIGSTLLGSWLGAFVVPLDWDKPWQVV